MAFEKEEYVKASLWKRLKLLATKDVWTLIASLLGLLSSIVSVVSDSSLNQVMRKLSHSVLEAFVPSAHSGELVAAVTVSGLPLRTAIIGGMMLVIMLFFFWSLVTLSFSKSPKAVDVAQEAVKTLSGFFIGAVTGFLG